MQFLILGYDGTDEQAPARRQAVREEHLEGAKNLLRNKNSISACAIKDEAGNMIGSAMIVEFESEQALHSQWLDHEVYVTHGVWQKVVVHPCAVPDFYLDRAWMEEG